MAQKAAPTKNQLLNQPWKLLVAALLAFVGSYAAASWAIESGRLTAYFITIVLLVLGAKWTIRLVFQTHGGKK